MSYLSELMPQKIGQYEIVRELGRGAMGVVYLGFDSGIARPVAIKTILLPQSGSPQAAESLKGALIREARAAGNITHPNIVTMYQMGEQDGMLYLAMEYLSGGSLEDRLTEDQPVNAAWAIHTLEQVASALDYAHNAGFVHRDIKPGNILLVNEEAHQIKIADFGLARMVNSSQSLDKIAGTPSYMSPEQVNGEKLDGSSDQFAVAQLAYRLLTGRVAFVAEDYRSLLTQIVMGKEPPAHLLNSNLHPQVSQVLSRGLAKLPYQRFFNCRDLVSNLRMALEGRATIAAPPPPPPPAEILVYTPAPSPGDPVVQPSSPVGAIVAAVLGLVFVVGAGWVAINSFRGGESTKTAPVIEAREIPTPQVYKPPVVARQPESRVPVAPPDVPKPEGKKEEAPAPKSTPAPPPPVTVVDDVPPANEELTNRLTDALRNRATPGAAVQDMLARGASAKGTKSRKPIVEAAWMCNEDAVRLLLAKGANPNVQDSSGRSALEELLTYINTAQNCPNALNVAKLLVDGGAKPDGTQGRDILSPPWQAAIRGTEWTPILKLLLEKGANPTLAISGATDPRVKVKDGPCNTSVVEMLLARGAKAEGWGKPGEPLRNAAKAGCPENVKLLLAKGVNPNTNSPDSQGKTALQLAARGNSVETVRALLDGGADPFAVDVTFQGRDTPVNAFEEAFEYTRNPQVIQSLFDSIRDLKKADRNGRTALHVAARAGNADIVKSLLAKGAPLNVRDKDGMTPLGRATGPAAKLLEAAGATK